MEVKEYGAIVIGAGQGGVPMAQYLAGRGIHTALIEREHVGGTCVNEGCTPTKTMVASAKIAYLASRGSNYGVDIDSYVVNMERIRERKRNIVNSFRSGSERRVEQTENLDFYKAKARFSAPRELHLVEANGKELKLKGTQIFIDTGSRPRIPAIQGIDSVPHLTSTTIMELDDLPKHLIIIGGGYIGAEFGQMFRRFGSEVSVVQHGPHLLSREDDDIAKAVEGIFIEDDINLHLECDPKLLEINTNGGIRLVVESPSGPIELNGSHLLVAAGRTPNTDDFSIENTGIELDDRGHIKVDDKLATTEDNVYAIGDVKGGPAFTHISYDDFYILRDNLFNDGKKLVSERMIPYTVYIDPQLGRIGLNEKMAKKQGIQYRLAKMPMEYSARALEVDESRGMAKALVDPQTDRILGCSILAPEGGEMMSALEIAMMGNVTASTLKEAIFAHPTYMEGFNTLFGMME